MTGTPLRQRVFDEHRRLLVPLAVALVINVVAYALLVYPLSQRVANVAERNRAAEQSLAAAKADYALASGTVTGKTRASQELATFYTKVLPADAAGARRLTHLRLAQLARQANLEMDNARFTPDERRKGSLERLTIEMDLAGTYPAMRAFIHQLEIAPEFVVIDNIELSEESDREGQLRVRLALSTYYRNGAS